MIGTYALQIAIGCFVFVILVAGLEYGLRWLQRHQERRLMRIRDDKMRRWGMAPYEPSARQKRL